MTKKYLDDTGLSNLVSNIKGIIPKVYYGTCSTAESTKDKVVVCPNFVLETGAVITINFRYGEGTSASSTLNVNDTGAVSIYTRQSSSVDAYAGNLWQAGEVVEFTYNGTGWVINNGGTIKQVNDLEKNKQDTIRYVTFSLSSTQSIAKSTFTKINYNTTEREGTSFATISSGTITFSEAGSYLILMNTIFDTNATNGRYQDILKGSTGYCIASSTGVTGVRTALNSSAIVSFDENDTFYGRAYQTTSGNLNLIGGSRITIIKIK